MSAIIDDNELIEAFYEEAQKLIDEMRKDLSILVSPLSKSEDQVAVLRRLFRYAHIIRGSSGSIGFDDLEKLTRALEKIFKAARDESFVITADVISLLFESVEVCQKLINKEEVTGHKMLLEGLNSILQPSGGK